jgi:hypothetical protein
MHRRGTAPQSLRAEVLAREALEIREPLQRVTRDEELALEVSRRLFGLDPFPRTQMDSWV